VSLSGDLEGTLLAHDQIGDLSTPAVSNDTPFGETAATGGQLVRIGHHARDFGEGRRWSGLGLEEVAQFLLRIFGLGWVPGDIGRLSLKEIGDEDAVLAILV
jgi:hypothetical protein